MGVVAAVGGDSFDPVDPVGGWWSCILRVSPPLLVWALGRPFLTQKWGSWGLGGVGG